MSLGTPKGKNITLPLIPSHEGWDEGYFRVYRQKNSKSILKQRRKTERNKEEKDFGDDNL